MTEQEFIAKFKKAGFGLYKINEITKKYRLLINIEKRINKIFKP